MINGRICLNLGSPQYFAQFFPYIDLTKHANTFRVTSGGVDYSTDNPPGAALSAWGAYVDADGNILNPSPVGATGCALTFYSLGADSQMNGGVIDISGTPMVCTFDGTGTVTITGEDGTVTRVGNRLTWTWGNTSATRQVTVTAMTASDPVRNIRIFKASNEARFDAGEIWDPRYISTVQNYSGMIRCMDHNRVNFNYSTRRYADIPTESYFVYSRETRPPGIKGSTPISALVKLANAAQSHLWTCIPTQFGNLKSAQATAIAKGATTIVTAPGHNFAPGDNCVPIAILGMTELEHNLYSVTAADATTFTLNVDSTAFGTFSSGANFNWFSSPWSIADMTTEVTLYVNYIKDNLDPVLFPAFEYSNETWNTGFFPFGWLTAMSWVNTPAGITQNSSRQMYGYLAAHIMKTVRDVYGPSNRDLWKGVLSTQTANFSVTDGALVGVQAYITNNAPGLTVADLFDYLGVTGYWSGSDGGVFASSNLTNIQSLCATSAARFTDGLEATKYSYFNRIVNEEVIDGRHFGTVGHLDDVQTYWAQQKVRADANGLTMVHYENGNHLNLGSSLKSDPTILEFYPYCTHTLEDAGNFSLCYSNWEAAGGIWPGKFVDCSPKSSAGSAFGGFRFDGDSNPVMDVVYAVNHGAPVSPPSLAAPSPDRTVKVKGHSRTVTASGGAQRSRKVAASSRIVKARE